MSKNSGRGQVAGLPAWDRCAVMGVVNVTPDSFSDGGRWFDTTAAVKHGLDLVAEGADLVDVGGESTRPGATRVDEAEELKRVVPVVRGLASEGVTVSVDTMRASVAEQAARRGRRPRQRRQRRPRRPRDDPGRRRRRRPLRGHALARLPARASTSGPCTRTSSPKSSTSSTRAWTAVLAGGIAAGPHRRRPGPRLRQGRRARPGPPRPPRPPPRPRPPRCWSPPPASGSSAACWPGRGRPAARPGARRRHRRRLRARRPPGRLGGPRPRGTGHRRRGPGRPGRGGRPDAAGPREPGERPRTDVEQVERPTPPSTRRWSGATSKSSRRSG